MKEILTATLLLIMLCTVPSPAAADASENYQLRMSFLEERLEDNQQHAKYWQYGWSGFFVSKLCANNVMCLELRQLLEVVSLLLFLTISRWLLCLWMHVRVETS